MKCLRCKAEMKHYPFARDLGIYGKVHQENVFSPIIEIPHNPNSVYVCEDCGYIELSTKECEESDI